MKKNIFIFVTFTIAIMVIISLITTIRDNAFAKTQIHKGWKTYTNNIFAYSLQYPQNWKIITYDHNVSYRTQKSETDLVSPDGYKFVLNYSSDYQVTGSIANKIDSSNFSGHKVTKAFINDTCQQFNDETCKDSFNEIVYTDIVSKLKNGAQLVGNGISFNNGNNIINVSFKLNKTIKINAPEFSKTERDLNDIIKSININTKS